MRITILTYCESDRDLKDENYDPVVKQVRAALEANKHKVSILAVHDDVRAMTVGLQRRKPDLVFNLMEMFGDIVTADIAVVGLLDLLGLRYTGCQPGELYLAQDKVLGKKILAFHQILFPRFAVFSKDSSFETGGNLRMPLFVKPARMDASIGIDSGGLVNDANTLMRRVLSIHEDCKDDALAEEYIDGREFYVSVIGNNEPQAFPPIEMDFSGMPPGMPHVMDAKAKFDTDSAEYKGTKAKIAEIPDELRAKLQKVSIEAFRALRVRDYGRVDLRLTDSGEIYVIEVNASCYLEKSGEFATAANAAGIEYPVLIQRIVDLAVERYQHDQGKKRRAKRSAA